MAQIAIIGAGGAIGGTVAAALGSRHDVTLCTRRPLGPVRVTTPTGDALVEGRNLTSPEQVTVRCDWVIVATKTYDAASTATWFPTAVDSETRVAILQNGVEHRERFAPWLTQVQIVPVVVQYPAERRADGSLLQWFPVSLDVDDSAAGQDFAQLFATGTVTPRQDFITVLWRKLCINAGGVVSALTQRPGGLSREAGPGDLIRAIVEECAAVGRAEGATLPDDIGRYVVEFYRKRAPDAVNSLLADRLAGRSMEVDARNGVVVRLGQRHGIATPLNAMAVTLLDAVAPERLAADRNERA